MKKSVVVLFLLLLFFVELLFWINTSRIVKELTVFEGKLFWRSSPKGRFLPWPKGPGPLEALSKASKVDEVFYTLIKTKVYLILLFIPLVLIPVILLKGS